MVKFDKVSVSYGSNNIYKDFSFDFPQGVNVVLGASGSGKTTLLKVVCNLVLFEGVCVSEAAAIVFQDPHLAPVSVLNNVLSVLKGKESMHIAKEMLAQCHVDNLSKRRATTLSGGEQQRVALARAFATNRSVLLLDEPFNSLDFGVKNSLYQTLDEMLVRYPKTVLLVTHDVEEAIRLADRIYILKGHPANLVQVAEIATPREQRDVFSSELLELRRRLQLEF